ncbi:MAG: energy transducer TonB [Clostridia bacterium]|nr:energy transducer TonB [Clostridia bacterium]
MISKTCHLLMLMIAAFPAIAQMGTFVDAQPYGGKSAMRDLMKQEMVYPAAARDADQEGTVKVAFIVKSDGSIADAKVVQSAGAALDKEALRLFLLLQWVPAMANGVYIDQWQETPIVFDLKKYNRCIRQRGYDQLPFPHELVSDSHKIYPVSQLDSPPHPLFDEKSTSFSDFINQNLQYPDAAMKQGVSGTVELYFVAEPSGNVSNIKVVQSVGAGCNEEAIRLLQMMRWFPGIKAGAAVRTALTLKITFGLSNQNKHQYVPANNANQI